MRHALCALRLAIKPRLSAEMGKKEIGKTLSDNYDAALSPSWY